MEMISSVNKLNKTEMLLRRENNTQTVQIKTTDTVNLTEHYVQSSNLMDDDCNKWKCVNASFIFKIETEGQKKQTKFTKQNFDKIKFNSLVVFISQPSRRLGYVK